MSNNKFKYFIVKEESLQLVPANTGNFIIISDNGAEKIYADINGKRTLLADITNFYTKEEINNRMSVVYKFKGSVNSYADLPKKDQEVGDVYNILTGDYAGANYAWDGSDWDKLSETVDLTPYLTKALAEQTYETITNVSLLKTSLEQALGTEQERAEDAEDTLTTNLSNEITRATGVEETISQNLSNEITRATGVEEGLRTDLNTEVTRATGKEGELSTAISNEVTRATGKEDELNTAIVGETSRAMLAESNLNTAIEGEVTRATGKEEELGTAISNEETRAKGVEEDLSSLIGDEITRATEKEEEIEGSISAEVTRATGKEGELATAISNEETRATGKEEELGTAISNEETRAKGVESDLSQAIADEQERAEGAESTLTTNLSNEVTRATGKEEELETAISDEETRAKGVEGGLQTAITAEQERAEEAEGLLETSISNHTSNTSNPHNVTKEQIGLGNVDNTSDLSKPVSTATQTELDKKLNIEDLPSNVSAFNNDAGYLVSSDISGKADASNVYTKGEVDTALAGKQPTGDYAIASDVYTKTEVDTAIASKADASNVYDKSEIDTALAGKQPAGEYATSTELSELSGSIEGKADKSTTIAGYGITNAYTKSEVNELLTGVTPDFTQEQIDALNSKITATKVTTYDGYATTIANKANTADVYTKSEVDAKVSSVYRACGSKDTIEELPTDAVVGDVWNIKATGANYVWTGSEWDKLSETIDLTPYLTTQTASETYETITNVSAHTSNTSNPHNVTKSQVGLGNVDNTSDLNKPISTATQTALDGKQDILSDAQLAACNSGVTATKVATYDGYATTIAGKQSSLSDSQITACNSGITSTKVATYDGYATTIAGKADASSVYTKSATDSAISTALESYYTSSEVDTKLGGYTSTTDLEAAFQELIDKIDEASN